MRSLRIKQFIFTFLLLISSAALFAQSTGTSAPPAASTTPDTVKTKKANAPKIKIVDGSPMSSAQDIAQNIAAAKQFSIFHDAITATNLTETFESTGPITVFAPVDSAFKKLTKDKLDSLLDPKNKFNLINMLTYHAIAGKLSSKDIDKKIKEGKGQAVFTTLAGGKLTASINENRNIVLTDENGGQSVISIFDIGQSNGLIDVITAVLIPKNKI